MNQSSTPKTQPHRLSSTPSVRKPPKAHSLGLLAPYRRAAGKGPVGQPKTPSSSASWAQLVVALILVLVPFHAVLSTWAGSNFGHLDLWRIWKELLMVPLAGYAVWRLGRQRQLARQLNQPLVWLVVAYTVLWVVAGGLAWQAGRVNSSALLYSWLTNLRLVWFMLLVWVIAAGQSWLCCQWRWLILGPALVVLTFGLLQRFVLPADLLKHVGYGPNTIPAVQTVDQKLAFRRIQSSLRGANPLGAYLVLVFPVLIAVWRRRAWRVYGSLALVAGSVVLFFSYSRSAYVGVVISSSVLIWQWLPDQHWRRWALGVLSLVCLLAAGTVWGLRHNDLVQNTLFHSDEHSQSATSSNQGRSQAWRAAAHDLQQEPWGRGPGTAGPASARNLAPARIAENYFLQQAQEAGWPGLALFVTINLLVARQLWRRRHDQLAQILLAALAGLTFVNLVSHAWSDDTLAIMFWGLVGLCLANTCIISTTGMQHGQKSSKTTLA